MKHGTNVGDLISRQGAFDALGEEPPVWYDGEDEIAERNQWRRDIEAIRNLPSAQPKELQILAKALDGCPLTDPCDRLWAPEGWCKEHCGVDQDFPDAECWMRYAEVVANGIKRADGQDYGTIRNL